MKNAIIFLMKKTFQRPVIQNIMGSIIAKHSLINIIIGPRQAGKTTAARDISSKWNGPVHYANADLSIGSGIEWIHSHWEEIRKKEGGKKTKKLLILDEIQKIKGWSDTVKGLWEEDKSINNSIRVLLLGSSSLLLTKGLVESLAGRFFIHRFTHWTYSECNKAFGWDIDKWIYFGGYPGATEFINNIETWKQYITDSLIETVITRDVLSLQTVTKPALLRNLFTLSTHFPAQILSYNKMLGQMHDAGNTTTLAHYLKLLESAFLVSGLENYSANIIRTKSSSPKLILWNNALINALDTRSYNEAKKDFAWWGRLIENALGAHLVNNLQSINYRVMYWRQENHEVDFIVTTGQKLYAIEVKSGTPGKLTRLNSFCKMYPKAKPLIVGTGGISFKDFFSNHPVKYLS